MPIGQSPWTTDRAAAMLNVSRSKTTSHIEALAEKIDRICPAIARSMKKPRPDRIASAVVSLLAVGGRIAAADPDGLRSFVRGRLEDGRAS